MIGHAKSFCCFHAIFDLLHDFSGTHGIKLTAIRRASKPAHGDDDLAVRLRI